MDQQRLLQAMRMLTMPVPAPRPPVAKPQDSFATLKVGQRLENLTEFHLGTNKVLKSLLWEVERVDSLGAKLQRLAGPESLVLRDREWKDKLFKRVRRPTKRKGKVTNG